MYVVFEEAGKFVAGRVLSRADSSLQAELESGKRVKLKTAQAVLEFDKPAPEVLLPAAQAVAAEVDLNLAWEAAPEADFDFAFLAREYFGAAATLAEQCGMLLALFGAPHYFRRTGGANKGVFKKASADILAQALAAIEKKAQVQAQIDAWSAALQGGQAGENGANSESLSAAPHCPEPITQQLYKILFKPDKNAPEYKAVAQACAASKLAPLPLLQRAGAIRSPYEFHWQRFLFDRFSRGVAFSQAALAAHELPGAVKDLPLAAVRAFSIDDSATTEIDDALSVQGLGSGVVTLGIHIAAPSLGLGPADALDAAARERMSTVYMPGDKITMLPEGFVQAYTLQAGKDCPAVSLYVQIDADTLQVLGNESRLERVPIAENLRYDLLDDVYNAAFFSDKVGLETEVGNVLQPAWSDELRFLHRFAKACKAQREAVRGKPEVFNRPDYNFKLERDKIVNSEGIQSGIQGGEVVHITERQRGAPLDLIVAECMIVANHTWGAWLASLGVPAIYRSQASLAPGIKVRMSTKALPHAGMGVGCYAWCTSPLRRYTDMVNQWQIVSAIRHGATAALAAPFKPKDATLLAIISNFDEAYAAYRVFQDGMERYWTLQYVLQNQLQELHATVVRDNMGSFVVARCNVLPLVLDVPTNPQNSAQRGQRVVVAVGAVDLLSLSIQTTLLRVETLETGAAAAPAELGEDAEDARELSSGALTVNIELEAPETTVPAKA